MKYRILLDNEDGFNAVLLDGYTEVATVYEKDYLFELVEAPELYTALEAILDSDGSRGTFDAFKDSDAHKKAEATLKKSRGES